MRVRHAKPRFHFAPFEKNYKCDFTNRQISILNGTIPLDEVATTELVALKRKAQERHDDENYEIAADLHYMKTHPDLLPNYSLEESRNILQSLTPWKINWRDTPQKKEKSK